MDPVTPEAACALATAQLGSLFCTCIPGAPSSGIGLYIVACGRCGGWKYLTPIPAST